MAMAVGTNRHYAVHTILGRHFLQTAKTCGLPDKMAREVIEEVGDTTARSLDRTLTALSKDFPETIATSITEGAKRRVNALGLHGKD